MGCVDDRSQQEVKVLKSGLGLATVLPGLRAVDAPLKRAFDKIDTHVNAWISQAQFAA